MLEAAYQSVLNNIFWLWDAVTFRLSWYENFFWGLILLSLLVWGLEILFPWRKNQKIIRKDFFLDAFYMFFNFFIFAIMINGFYAILEQVFRSNGIKMNSFQIIETGGLPPWVELVIFFLVLDFVQWITHIILHKVPVFWEFHKVHHSVKEMGFAAHLRFHWMENILYKPLKTLGIMLLGGFEPEQAYIVHFAAITIGHLNHANLKLTYGPLKYIFNNPVMHLYHHAYHLPKGSSGINYGISLSLWDYLFGTHHIPEDSGTIELGFEGDEYFPKRFIKQSLHGFRSKKAKRN